MHMQCVTSFCTQWVMRCSCTHVSLMLLAPLHASHRTARMQPRRRRRAPTHDVHIGCAIDRTCARAEPKPSRPNVRVANAVQKHNPTIATACGEGERITYNCGLAILCKP